MADKSLLASLRTQLAEKRAEADRIAGAFPTDEQGRFSISTEMHQDFVKVVKAGEEIKSLIDIEETRARIGEYLDAPADAAPPAAAQHFGSTGPEVKSLADYFIDSPAFQEARASNFTSRPYIRAGVEGKSIFNLSAGTATIQTLGSAQNLGIAELARRKTHIRDLFPRSTTNASVLYGVRETGWVNNAKQVKQRYAADGTSPATGGDTDVFGKAPRSKLTLVPVLYPVAEVAHLIDAHKNILADEPRLRTFINTRMVEGVKYAEDYDLLHSTGDAERITGLFNVSGVQTYTGLNTDKYSVQVRRAITKALLAEYDPSGLVVSPSMWESVEVEEDDNGQFRIATQVATGAVKTVWRLSVVETTAMADETFLLGAFGMGAQLYDREAVSVTASSENSDNFDRGVITIRADERISLTVDRPEAFVIGSWTTPV